MMNRVSDLDRYVEEHVQEYRIDFTIQAIGNY
jgi:hypothetical protein